MRNMSELELSARINAFMQKKSAKFPTLRNLPRLIAHRAFRRTHAHAGNRLNVAMQHHEKESYA
jgi:hypothetical protein